MDERAMSHVHDDDESMHHHPDDVRTASPDEAAVVNHVHDDDESLPHDDGFDIDDAVAVAEDGANGAVDQLRGLVSWIVNQLVDEPENVVVDAVERGSSVQVRVRLPESDLGKIIGRGGRIAKSMRTALMIVGSRHHLRVSLDIEGQS
ncbi:MAG TPA: KH domain-containing protein [Thermomicrobiales bacterium]|nr:KH domain-containing protein [Thermomicrobiales bacterium]